MKKRFWPIFSRDIEHDKCQGTVYKGSQGFSTVFVQMIWTFFCHLRGRLKKTFQKTAVFTMKEVFGPFFFVLSSVTNLKEQIIRVYRLFRQLLWNLLEHFSGHKRLLKSPIFEKKANFQWRNIFGLFFLLISNMLNFRKQFIRAHKVFWHLFCQWYEPFCGT